MESFSRQLKKYKAAIKDLLAENEKPEVRVAASVLSLSMTMRTPFASGADTLFAKLYEDWSAGRMTEYNFNMRSEKYQGEQLPNTPNEKILVHETVTDEDGSREQEAEIFCRFIGKIE